MWSAIDSILTGIDFILCMSCGLREFFLVIQVGMQKELEIATAEMDRAQHRLVMLEREKENLKQQVSSAYGRQTLLRPCAQAFCCGPDWWSFSLLLVFQILHLPAHGSRHKTLQVNREANHSVASEASSRQNDAQLKAELSTQRDLVSRLHAELGTGEVDLAELRISK